MLAQFRSRLPSADYMDKSALSYTRGASPHPNAVRTHGAAALSTHVSFGELDSRCPDDFRCAGHVVSNEAREVIRRARKDIKADRGKSVPQIRTCKRRDDLAIQAFDDRLRRP